MSDLYDRCPHNERPSRCLACAHDTIERLHSDVADLMAAKLAEQRQTVQMSRMYDGVVDLLRELRPLLDRDDLKRHYVAVRDRIDAALAGTVDQPEKCHHGKTTDEDCEDCDRELNPLIDAMVATVQPTAAHVHSFTMGVCACGERSDAYLYY